jgi:hypothetical protein
MVGTVESRIAAPAPALPKTRLATTVGLGVDRATSSA